MDSVQRESRSASRKYLLWKHAFNILNFGSNNRNSSFHLFQKIVINTFIGFAVPHSSWFVVGVWSKIGDYINWQFPFVWKINQTNTIMSARCLPYSSLSSSAPSTTICLQMTQTLLTRWGWCCHPLQLRWSGYPGARRRGWTWCPQGRPGGLGPRGWVWLIEVAIYVGIVMSQAMHGYAIMHAISLSLYILLILFSFCFKKTK